MLAYTLLDRYHAMLVSFAINALFCGRLFMSPAMRPIPDMVWRVRERLAYRRAGTSDWYAAAYLRAYGISPADFLALVDAGYSPGEVSNLGFGVEKPDRVVGPGLVRVLLAAARYDKSEHLGRFIARAPDMVAFVGSGPTVAYLTAGFPVRSVTLLAEAGVSPEQAVEYLAVGFKFAAAASWARLGVPPGIARRIKPAAIPGLWEQSWARLVQANEATWEDYASWSEVCPPRSGAGRVTEYAQMIAVWRAVVGDDGPWWAAAGYRPEEAVELVRSGAVPSREQLVVMSALRSG